MIVGAGYTGLWAARHALADDPGRDVVVLDAGTAAVGASGRNGGFLSASITHGAANGRTHFPDELATLVRLGNENYDALLADLGALGIDAAFEPVGEIDVAVAPWQADELPEYADLLREVGEEVELLDADAVRAQVASPTFLGGVWTRSHVGLVDPARLAWGLLAAVQRAGARVHEHTPVTAVEDDGDTVVLRGPHLHVRARRVLLATNAFPGLVAPIRRAVVPVYDHVLVTEPLSDEQWAAVGWGDGRACRTREPVPLLPAHARRPDPLGRMGRPLPLRQPGRPRARAGRAHVADPGRALPGHLPPARRHPLHPPLGRADRHDVAVHVHRRHPPRRARWRGRSATPAWAWGRAGSAPGWRSTCWPAADTERTRLAAVRKPPFPFPPEPLRWAAVQATRRAIARADAHDGRRGPWLRLLDRFGIGFDS